MSALAMTATTAANGGFDSPQSSCPTGHPDAEHSIPCQSSKHLRKGGASVRCVSREARKTQQGALWSFLTGRSRCN